MSANKGGGAEREPGPSTIGLRSPLPHGRAEQIQFDSACSREVLPDIIHVNTSSKPFARPQLSRSQLGARSSVISEANSKLQRQRVPPSPYSVVVSVVWCVCVCVQQIRKAQQPPARLAASRSSSFPPHFHSAWPAWPAPARSIAPRRRETVLGEGEVVGRVPDGDVGAVGGASEQGGTVKPMPKDRESGGEGGEVTARSARDTEDGGRECEQGSRLRTCCRRPGDG